MSKYTQRREPQQDIQSLYKEYFENKRQRVCKFTAEVQETAEDNLDDEKEYDELDFNPMIVPEDTYFLIYARLDR